MSVEIRMALRARRKTVGMSQEQLGYAVGRDQAAISDYETGRNAPSMETLTRLADALDCDVVLQAHGPRATRTEYAWACPESNDSELCLHPDDEETVRKQAAHSGRVVVREVTDWRAES